MALQSNSDSEPPQVSAFTCLCPSPRFSNYSSAGAHDCPCQSIQSIQCVHGFPTGRLPSIPLSKALFGILSGSIFWTYSAHCSFQSFICVEMGGSSYSSYISALCLVLHSSSILIAPNILLRTLRSKVFVHHPHTSFGQDPGFTSIP